MSAKSKKWGRPTGLVLLLVLTGAGCDSATFGEPAQVRIENGADLMFDEAAYYAGNDLLTYTSLAPGDSSPYVSGDGNAYSYTTTWVVLGADTLRLQVIDFVGETPLSEGRYTYVLDVDEAADGSLALTQTLREDG